MNNTLTEHTDTVDKITRRDISELTDQELADLSGETTSLMVYTSAGKIAIPVASTDEALYMAEVEPHWMRDLETCVNKRAALASVTERDDATRVHIEALDRATAHMAEGVRRHYETRQREYREREAMRAAIARAEASLRLFARHRLSVVARRAPTSAPRTSQHARTSGRRVHAARPTGRATADPDGGEPPSSQRASSSGGAL